MAVCVSNTTLGRIGCGAKFHGELQHSVATVSWSTLPDSMAHMTAVLSVIDECWAKGKGGEMADPASLGFEQDRTGRWRRPMTAENRARRAAHWASQGDPHA